jgi:hypothetical protein
MPQKNSNRKTAKKTATRAVAVSPINGARIVPGNPGNSGGKPGRSGRPKSEVREACRAAFNEAMPTLLAIALGKLPDVSYADRIRAADVLGKYGGMTFTETEAKIEDRTPARVVFYLPDNGRSATPQVIEPARSNGSGAGPRGIERRNWATRPPDEPDTDD